MKTGLFIGSGLELQAMAQILLCTEVEEFYEIFREKHSPEWIAERHRRCQDDFAGFLCGLDCDNLARVFEFVVRHPAMLLAAKLGRGT